MRENLEEKEKIKVLEASAKSNINVNNVFIELIDRTEKLNLGVKHQSSYEDNNDDEEEVNPGNQSIKLNNKKENNNNCCLKKNK